MKTFRQKIFVSYFILLLLFLALVFPFVRNSVEQIVFRSMDDRAEEIIAKLQESNDIEDLLRILRDQKYQLFYRVSILDSERRLLYDSHTKRLMGPLFFPLQFATHPEVEEAFQSGTGYAEGYSHLLEQKLVYVARLFSAHGKQYVLRLSFPYDYIRDLNHDFEIGFLFICTVVLTLFSVMIAFVLNHLSSPIREITRAIGPYSQGKDLASLPTIQVKTTPGDEFSLLVNTLNSLSERIKLEINTVTKERNERETVLESLAEGVLAIDEKGEISYANTHALELLDLDRSIIGKTLPQTLPKICMRAIASCSVEGAVVFDEIEIEHKTLGHLYLSLVASPRAHRGEAAKGVILVLQDRSVHYRLLQMRKDFIANASHELKTPITVIRGFTETLQENPELPRETQDEITSKIVKNCKRMTKIIHNLLTLADIENLPISRLTPISLKDLSETCFNTVKAVYPTAICELNLEDDHDAYEITCDPELMETAVHNLLDNGAKYSSTPAHLTLSLKRDNGFIELSVKDAGIGIPESDIESIFQRFYTVDKAHSKKLGGSGLGLSIVETIVHKHFGTISVKSKLGEGSTFTLRLPTNLNQRILSAVQF